MPDLFADTGYWIALLTEDDSLHQRAVDLTASLGSNKVVTTDLVFTELLNHMSGNGNQARLQTAEAVREWRTDPNLEVIPLSAEQFETALERYAARLDQSWSLVDCASFVAMESVQINQALAHDRHFEQAGFTALLRTFR